MSKIKLPKVIGYCRISTPTQSLDRQERNIKDKYPDAFIVKEVYTGRKSERPEWTKIYTNAYEGQTIIFDEVSRMSRNATEGFELYKELYDKGVELVFIKEPHISTSVLRKSMNATIATTGQWQADLYIETTNVMLMKLAEEQIKLAFEASQHEVDFLSQRTKEGIETARLLGKQIGGKTGSVYKIKVKEAIKEIIQKKSKAFGGGNNDPEVMAIINVTKYTDEKGIERTYHISPNTYYKYKRELKLEYYAEGDN